MDNSLLNSLDAPKHIATKDKDGMFQIFLNHPPMNAFSAEMVEEINGVLGSLLYRNDLKVVVFLTTAKNFSTGIAPEDFANDKAYQVIEAMGRMFEQLQTLNVPVLSLVPGMAMGAGFELVMFSDLAIATESATFGLPDIQLGLIPAFACNILQQYIPPKKAAELIFTGATITAREAQEFGLINLVVPDDKLADQAGVLVRKLLQYSAPVLQLAKKSMIQVQGKSLEESLRTIEEIYLNELLSLDDSKEGIRAFFEKRKPIWKNQ